MGDISRSEFICYGYINGFRLRGENWFCQASLIVDKKLGEEHASKPFIFQSVSLPVFGTAKKLLDAYSTEDGAVRGFGAVGDDGKKRVFRFRIGGYRVEKTDNPEFPFDVKGRILSIDDSESE